MHERFLPLAAWNEQDVKLRRFVDRRVGQQSQAGQISNRVFVFLDGQEARVGNTRQRFERTGKVALVHVRENQRANRQVDVQGNCRHNQLQ